MVGNQPRAVLLAIYCGIAPCASLASPTADDYITCTLVYGALFQAAKDTQHEPILKYVRPRLNAVLPWVKANEDMPQGKQLLREKAMALEQEVKVTFMQNVKTAIVNGDTNLLRSSFGRVFACDRALGIASYPLPAVAAPLTWNRYADGFYTGCVDKQTRTSPQVPVVQVHTYCRCMTNAIAAKRITAESADATISATIKGANGACLASIGQTSSPAR